jgi:hypothetical protein
VDAGVNSQRELGGMKTRKATKKAKKPERKVFCMNALDWLPKQSKLDSIVTSIPEMDEVGLKLEPYLEFFRTAASLCLQAVKDKGYCIFLQTDRKYKGWVDKSYYLSDEAQKLGYRCIWHKIALRTEVGKTDLFRPTYSHMICFSKEGPIGKPIPDVVYRGEMTYPNAFGLSAVELVVRYLKDNKIKTIYDCFVGSGTTLAVANALGLNAVGVDLDPKQCEKAKKLSVTLPSESSP